MTHFEFEFGLPLEVLRIGGGIQSKVNYIDSVSEHGMTYNYVFDSNLNLVLGFIVYIMYIYAFPY